VIILTLGSFDMLHVGHLELLETCRKMAGPDGRVVVGLNTDAFITRYKRRAPLQPYGQREEMLRSCRFVDLVVANLGEEDSRGVIETVRPDLLAIGDDWLDRDYLGQLGITATWLQERHLAIEYVPRTRGVSTTQIRERLAA
jgi:glycerol-3-phosphate cytidylyltransferase